MYLEMSIKLINITKSKYPGKKYDANILVGGKKRVVPFGAAGMSDYTINKDPKRRELYLQRHRKREDWKNPRSAGFWSRWYLWEATTKAEAESLLRARFGL